MEYISLSKRLIEKGDLNAFRELVIASADEPGIWDHLFSKVYLHTCLCIGKNKRKGLNDVVSLQESIHSFLVDECFPRLPEIQRLAVRQIFAYGNWLRR
jgi:hypothetical protein